MARTTQIITGLDHRDSGREVRLRSLEEMKELSPEGWYDADHAFPSEYGNLPDIEEGESYQLGSTVIVTVHERYRNVADGDDGLREVQLLQLELADHEQHLEHDWHGTLASKVFRSLDTALDENGYVNLLEPALINDTAQDLGDYDATFEGIGSDVLLPYVREWVRQRHEPVERVVHLLLNRLANEYEAVNGEPLSTTQEHRAVVWMLRESYENEVGPLLETTAGWYRIPAEEDEHAPERLMRYVETWQQKQREVK